MKRPAAADLDGMWARHSAEWRDGAQICSQWSEASAVEPSLIESKVTGAWWSTLERLGITLLVTREYEHLVIALSAPAGRRRMSYLPLPHPSGLCVDRETNRVFIASTRNPNQVFEYGPAGGTLAPVRSVYYPGCLYLHDLAVLRGVLYGSAVGCNSVVRLGADGGFERVWWPKCVESGGRPIVSRNHIQLNSIGGGDNVRDSYYSASSDRITRLRPGHVNYPVDRRGVVFSGKTREPICTGLTRPHSVRLHQDRIWVDNSGYGEFGYVDGGRLRVVRVLPGWTRGLCLLRDVAFVGLSRVIPRFMRYAPGLDPRAARCGVTALDLKSGRVLGSIEWPHGNQIFAIDWIRDTEAAGFPFGVRSRRRNTETAFFYRYTLEEGISPL